jgi:general secretion pathway protein J
MMPITENNKGFTLLEILLAFFIFAILFSVIFASYSASFKTINMTESRMEVYRKAAIAMDRISEDIQAAYISIPAPNSFGEPAGYTKFLGEDKDINGLDADTMSFFSRIAPLFSEEMEMATGQLIFYDVIQGDEEGELILLRSEHPEFIDESEEKESLTLCDGLQGVSFTYFNGDGEPQESWDSDSDELEGSLPRMVSVSLQFLNHENPEAPLTFMTSIALPVNYVPGLQNDGIDNGNDNGNDNTFATSKRSGIKMISGTHRARNDGLKDAT